MPLQRSLTQLFRKSNIMPASGWRAFFAPFNIELASQTAETNVGPTILDLMNSGPITDSALPTGWRDLGWLKDVTPTPGTKIGQVRSGFHGIVRAQYKGEITETIEFKMREITRTSLKISTGSDVFNLLDAPGPVTTVGPVSASGGFAADMASYDPDAVAGPTVTLSVSASGALFAQDDYIVVDVDYNPADFGLVGSNGTPLFENSATDTEYIRKTSDFVAKIASVNGADLILAEKLVGGGSGPNSPGSQYTVPPAGSKVQKIKGFASREGGSFIMDWSGLFLLDTLDGAQFAWYYPHLSTMQFRGLPTWAIENIGTTDLAGYELDAVMNALAFDDPIDGHPVVCYRAFYPRGRKQLIAI